jgi:hypothetical protein
MRAPLPKHPFLCDSHVPSQELIYWWFWSNWRFQSISIARQPFRSPFRLPFRSFRSISIYFDHFDLFQSILIYFDHFDSYRSISIHFDSDIGIAKTFRWRAGHFDRSITSQKKWRMMAAVATSPLSLSLPLCRNMTYHGWYEDSVMEKWKNNNKPMRRNSNFVAQIKKRCGPNYALSRLFWPFFLCTYYLLDSL